MNPPRKIAFILEEFKLDSPAQQLLDRFLSGYPKNGAFHTLAGTEIAAHLRGAGDQDSELLFLRVQEHGLRIADPIKAAVKGADGIVVVWKEGGAIANEPLLEAVLQAADRGASVFVHGRMANTSDAFARLLDLAAARGIRLRSGTATSVAFRLPEVDLLLGTHIRESLIVVQGTFPQAELDGLEGLFPLLELRFGGETGIKRVRYARGAGVWNSASSQPWSKPMLAAAISRSNTVQGDVLRDGRTQDIVGLGLIQKLALKPRAWLLEHKDGLRSGIIILDGAVTDINFAIRQNDGEIISAQLYRPPAPAREHYSHLAGSIEDFFCTEVSTFPIERSKLIVETLQECRRLLT